jgi:hypothetical protein
MGVDEVASADPSQLEAEAVNEMPQVAERHVRYVAACEAREELTAIHGRTVALRHDGACQ